jgi:hypothetical protein
MVRDSEVEHQRIAARRGKGRGEMKRERRFADAALLFDERNRLHSSSPCPLRITYKAACLFAILFASHLLPACQLVDFPTSDRESNFIGVSGMCGRICDSDKALTASVSAAARHQL